jgi:hypothetical protein
LARPYTWISSFRKPSNISNWWDNSFVTRYAWTFCPLKSKKMLAVWRLRRVAQHLRYKPFGAAQTSARREEEDMSEATIAEKLPTPIRAGIFSSVENAEKAIRKLLAAGFSKDQITVVTSDKGMRRHFSGVKYEEPAGAHTEEAVALGSSLGSALGAIATGAVGLLTGGVPLIVIGTYGLLAGGVAGGFIGAMLTRGIETELANFYDQEVGAGNLLVAVEVDEASSKPSLEDAERLLAEAGAKPLALPEG